MTKKILIIRENNLFNNIIKKYFQKNKYEIEISNNGYDGINKAINNRPDIIILDTDSLAISDHPITKKLKSNDILKAIPIITFNSILPESILPAKII